MSAASRRDLAPSALAAELLNTNLHNYGPKRLEALPQVVRSLLLSALVEGSPPEAVPDQVAALLRAKKRANVAKNPPPPPPTPRASPPPTPPQRKLCVFVQHPSLKILSFNALKLRVDKPELLDAWRDALRVFVEHDVIVVQEVCASEHMAQRRVRFFLDLLCEAEEVYSRRVGAAARKWDVALSEPSAASARDKSPEVHAFFYAEPLRLLSNRTHHRLEYGASSCEMSHAPFSALFEKPCDQGGSPVRLVVTSVHLPPISKATQRNTQLKSLLQWYPKSSDMRLKTAFDGEVRDDNFVAHIVTGDFNADAAALQDAGGKDWQVVLGRGGRGFATSSGRRAYDNFLVSAPTEDVYLVGGCILELSHHANSSRGIDGLSDHSPIGLTLTRPRAAVA